MHGKPRFTNDIDVVVNLSIAMLARIQAAFPSDAYYLDEEAARSATVLGGTGARQFNILDLTTFDKLDVYPRRETPYDHAGFGRYFPDRDCGCLFYRRKTRF